jgi:tetratricopeptide (TPR) repeat protein
VLSVGVVVLAALVALGISAALIARRAEIQLLEAQTRESQLRSQQVRTLLALGDFDQREGNARAKEDFASALQGAQGDRQIAEANRGLGIEEFRAGNHLAAFARFTESLTAAEAWIKRERNNAEAYSAMAAANYLMGQALVANGETGAAGPKLHKAFEMFRDLAGSPDVNPEDQSAEAYEAAIRQLAKVAPAGLANSIGGTSLFAETRPENH